MKNRRIVPTLIYLVLLIAVFSWLSGVFTQSQDQIPYSTVLKLFRNEQVKSFVVDDHVMTMELRSAYNGQTSLTATIADVDRFVREMEPLLQAQTDSGVLEYYHFRPEKEPSAYDLVLPLVLDIDGIWYALVFAETAALVISAVLLAKNRKRYHYV